MNFDTQDLPYVTAICPSFHRSKLLANALACFLAQDYPEDHRQLIILDDGNDFADNQGQYLRSPALISMGWHLFSAENRYPSLTEKFNAAAKHVKGQIILVWEDDDLYTQNHITNHVLAMTAVAGKHPASNYNRPWLDNGVYNKAIDWVNPIPELRPQDVDWGDFSCYSKPSSVMSDYTGQIRTENATGRFHASIGFTRYLFDKVGGWPNTKRADFDQQFMSILAQNATAIADPCEIGPPSYCFRFGSTGHYHGQSFMKSPADENWMDRIPRRPGNRSLMLYPQMDDQTKSIYSQMNAAKPNMNADQIPATV